MKKLIIALLVLSFAGNATARNQTANKDVKLSQQNETAGEQLVTLEAVAPVFSPAGLAVRASGKVIVKVKITPGGEVESANAVSGHPLLRQASVDAAHLWKFKSSNAKQERETNLTFNYRLLGIDDTENNSAVRRKDYSVFKSPLEVEIVVSFTKLPPTKDF